MSVGSRIAWHLAVMDLYFVLDDNEVIEWTRYHLLQYFCCQMTFCRMTFKFS